MPKPEGLNGPAAEVAPVAGVGEEAQKMLRPGVTSAEFVGDLAKAGLFPDAVKVLAHAIGGRKCIDWSLACLAELKPGTPKEETTVLAVRNWLEEPSDANRRAAQAAAQEAKVSTPAGCVAMATFYTEGSIAPAGASEVPPPRHVAERIAAGGVLLAVVLQPENAAERYQLCLKAGLDAK